MSVFKAQPSLPVTAPRDDIEIDEPLSLQQKTMADALEKVDSMALDAVDRPLKKRGVLN